MGIEPKSHVIVLLLAGWMAIPAHAQTSERIAVIAGDTPSIAERICQELETLGFETVLLDEAGASDLLPSRLEQVARANRAMAAIRVGLEAKTAEVWIAERVTNKTVYRSITLEPGDRPAAALLAVAAVELLRASLMEIHGPNPQSGEMAPTKQVEAFAAPAEKESIPARSGQPLFAAVGLGGTYVGQGAALTAGLLLSLDLELLSYLRFGLMGVVPISEGEKEIPQGTIRYGLGLLGAGISAVLRDEDDYVRPCFGLGFGTVVFRVTGHGNSGDTPPAAVRWSGTPVAHAGVVFSFNNRLSLRASATGGWAISRHSVEVDGQEVSLLGRPWILGSIDLELAIR